MSKNLLDNVLVLVIKKERKKEEFVSILSGASSDIFIINDRSAM